MAEPVDALSLRKAIIETPSIRRAGGSPIEATIIQLGKEAAKQDPHIALEQLAGREPPAKEIALQVVDQSIGPVMEVNRTTGLKNRTARTSEVAENKRFQRGNEVIESVYKLIEKGEISAQAKKGALQVLYSDQGFRTILRAYDSKIDVNLASYIDGSTAISGNVEKIVNSILRNPEYIVKLKELVQQRIDPAKLPEVKSNPLDDEIEKLRSESKWLEENLDEKKAGSKAGQLENVKQQLFDFEYRRASSTRATISQLPNPGAQEIIDLSHKQGRLESLIHSLSLQVDNYAKLIALNLNPQDTQNQIELNRLTQEMADKNAELQATKEKKQDLVQKREELRREKQRFEEEIRNLKKKQDEIDRQLREKEQERGPGQQGSQIKEEEFIYTLESLFADSTKEFLKDKLQKVEQKYQELIEERKKKEIDEIKKKLDEKLKDQWWADKKAGIFTKRMIKDIDKKSVDADVSTLLDNGPKGLIDSILKTDIENYIKSKYGGVTTLTSEMKLEVENKITEITAERGDEVALRLLTLKLRTGTLRIEEVRRIQFSDWGKDMIKNALKQNNELTKEIESVAGEGVVRNLDRLPQGIISKIILAILTFLGMGIGGLFSMKREG